MTHIPTLRVKFWTANKVQQLLDLNEEEMSASRIGRILGCSRNAIIGKLNRMGRNLKASTTSKEFRHRVFMREYRPRPDSYHVASQTPSPDEPASLNISMMDIRDGECRFIASDPAQGATLCGHPTLPNRAWCWWHFRRVFQPAKPYVPAELRG